VSRVFPCGQTDRGTDITNPTPVYKIYIVKRLHIHSMLYGESP